MNGNIFIALLHSGEPVDGPLLVVAQSASGCGRRSRQAAGRDGPLGTLICVS